MRVAVLKHTPEVSLRWRGSRPTRVPKLEDTLRRMPKDLGIVLLSLGVAGLAIPGPVPPGTPFIIVGVACTCPGLVKKFGGSFLARFPRLYVLLNDQARRFQSDLERRYPGSTRLR